MSFRHDRSSDHRDPRDPRGPPPRNRSRSPPRNRSRSRTRSRSRERAWNRSSEPSRSGRPEWNYQSKGSLDSPPSLPNGGRSDYRERRASDTLGRSGAAHPSTSRDDRGRSSNSRMDEGGVHSTHSTNGSRNPTSSSSSSSQSRPYRDSSNSQSASRKRHRDSHSPPGRRDHSPLSSLESSPAPVAREGRTDRKLEAVVADLTAMLRARGGQMLAANISDLYKSNSDAHHQIHDAHGGLTNFCMTRPEFRIDRDNGPNKIVLVTTHIDPDASKKSRPDAAGDKGKPPLVKQNSSNSVSAKSNIKLVTDGLSFSSVWGAEWSKLAQPMSGPRYRSLHSNKSLLFRGTISKKSKKVCSVVVQEVHRTQTSPSETVRSADILEALASASSLDMVARVQWEKFFEEVSLPRGAPSGEKKVDKKLQPISVGVIVPDSVGDEQGLNWLSSYLSRTGATRAGYLRLTGGSAKSVPIRHIHVAVLPATSRYHDSVMPGCSLPILVVWYRAEEPAG